MLQGKRCAQTPQHQHNLIVEVSSKCRGASDVPHNSPTMAHDGSTMVPYQFVGESFSLSDRRSSIGHCMAELQLVARDGRMSRLGSYYPNNGDEPNTSSTLPI